MCMWINKYCLERMGLPYYWGVMDCREFVRLIKMWKREVCLFGAGECGRTWGYQLCSLAGFNIAFYCDNQKHGYKLNKLEVHNSDYLLNYKEDILVIVSAFGDNGRAITEQLQEMGLKNVFWLCEGDPINELLCYLEDNEENDLLHKLDKVIGDEAYIKRWYSKKFGYDLDLNNPVTFNEKIQWLKLNDRNNLYTKLVDKYEVKGFVKEKIGEGYIIPTIGIYKNFSEIDFSVLPKRFVIKCTHDSGSVVKCLDKQKLNHDKLQDYFLKKMMDSEYLPGREWSYKGVKPRIIVEELIEEKGTLKDYKVHCFNGEPLFLQVIGDRDLEKHTAKQIIYDFAWKLQPWSFGDYPRYAEELPRPTKLDELYHICKVLCKGMKYVRLDFYILEEGIKFGEFTFYPLNGAYTRNEDWTYEVDRMLGDKIVL